VGRLRSCVPERTRLEAIKDVKHRLEEAKHDLEVAQRQGEYDKASKLRYDTIPNLQKQLPKEGDRRESEENEIDGKLGLHDRVTSEDISKVVAKATGIPVQNLLKGEREKLVRVSGFSCCNRVTRQLFFYA
jgi:ATP-dependent Clp protease ATP-binding subunit ClpB